jgi:hypothetical protein
MQLVTSVSRQLRHVDLVTPKTGSMVLRDKLSEADRDAVKVMELPAMRRAVLSDFVTCRSEQRWPSVARFGC